MLAAAGGLAVGEVVAAPVRSWLSPVVAIADRVVDAVPQPVKQFAIDTFGTNDKLALLVGILTILSLAAFGIGLLARTRRRTAMALTGSFGVIGVVASLADPSLSPAAALPSLAAGVAAVAVLGWLFRDQQAADGSRRVVLRELGYVVAGVAVLGAGGRWLGSAMAASASAEREQFALPEPIEPVTFPADAAVDVEGVVPYETPNEDFYRIDTQIGTPRLSRDGWTLRVHGMVDQERTFTLDELVGEFEVIERAITLTCVSLEIGGDLVGNARWRGVRVADVLDTVGVDPAATQLVGRAFDDFTTGYPVERAFDRDALLAIGMNGEPLPPAHGYPLRMVVPGLYGYVSATKWLTDLELTTFQAFDQYWVERDWDERAPIKTMSRIDTPSSFDSVDADAVVPVAGVAWAQTRGIQAVEVRVDGGPWQQADLASEFSDVTWRQWRWGWDTGKVAPGRHDLEVRAVDGTGEVQTEERQPPFPNGATGWHRVVVTVADPGA